MRTHTQDFKNKIKDIRETEAIITYNDNGNTITLNGDNIKRLKYSVNGDILKSIMKQLEIKIDRKISKDTILNLNFGAKINNNYEYLNYGNFIVYEVEEEKETGYFNLLCYDKMLYSMKEYESLGVEYPISIKDYINAICSRLGLTFKDKNNVFANYNKTIPSELYLSSEGKSYGYTYRDVLDELAQVTASAICINENDELEIRYFNDTTISEIEIEGKNIYIAYNDGDSAEIQVLGDTYQQTYSGKNLFDNNTATTTVNGVTLTNNGDGTYTLNGQATSGISIDFFPINTIPSGTYKVVGCPAGGSDNTYYLATRFDGVWGNRDTGNGATITFTTFGKLSLSIAQGVRFTNALLKPMITSDLTATYNDYEPYVGGQPSPNPSYPQSVETVTGRQEVIVCGKNLFDKDNANIINGSFSASDSITVNNNVRSIYIPIQPNTTYTISKQITSNRFRAGTTDVLPASGVQVKNVSTNDSGKTLTVTSDSNSKYLIVYFWINGDTSTEQQILNGIQIEKGSSKTEYQAYQGNTYEINLGKNLLSIDSISSQTFGDFTITNNGDGTFTFNGTTSDTVSIKISDDMYDLPSDAITFSRNYTGTQTGGTFTTILYGKNQGENAVTLFSTTADPYVARNLARYDYYYMWIYIPSGRTFTNYVFRPQIERGSTASSYAPYFTPIELCKIDTYQDKIDKSTGKNLFDKDTISIAKQVNINTITQLSSGIKINYSNVSSGCYVAYNLGTYDKWFGKTINFSSNVVNNTSRSSGLYLWCADDTNLSPLTVLKETYNTGTSFTLSDNYTFNDSSLKSKIVVLVLYKRGTTAVTTSDYTEFNNLQIEQNTQATEYEPYGTNWYIKKAIKKIDMSTITTWGKATDGNFYSTNFASTYNISIDTLLSNIFTYSESTWSGSGNFGITSTGNLWITTGDATLTDANNVPTWLSNKNAVMYGILATPTYTEITDSDLIGELEDIELLEGMNNIDVDSPNLNAYLHIKYINEIDTIDEDYLKNINVTFKEKYGPVNSVVLSRSLETDNVYLRNETSVATNGLCEVKIKDNQIMNFNDRSEYLPDILEKLNGLKYYANDFDSNGILYYEFYDIYNVSIENKKYKCLLLNDEITIESGLSETIYTQKPDTSVSDYEKASKDDTKATLELDKINSRLKVVAKKITLTTSDDGNSAGIVIQAFNENDEKISEASGTIEMSGKVSFTDLSTSNPTTTIINGDNITTGVIKSSNYVANTSGTKIDLSDGTIDSKNFKLDATGQVTATNVTLTGGEIKSSNYVSGSTGTKINLNDGSIDSRYFKVSSTGQITSTGGTIGGWTIDSSNGFTGGTNISLYKDGRMSLKKNGWLNAGDTGYWLLGNGTSYKALLGDDYSFGNNITSALTVSIKRGSDGEVISETGTAGVITTNGSLVLGAKSELMALSAQNMNIYTTQNMAFCVDGTLNYRVSSLYMNGREGRTITIIYRNSNNQNRDLYFENGILVGYT